MEVPFMVRLNAVGRRIALASVLTIMLFGVSEARITIRLHSSPSDSFFFHGNYSAEPFDPSDGIGLELWNCGSGDVPTFVADREAVIVCRHADGSITPGYLVYAVDVPAGACVDHGRSCYYRNSDVPFRSDGVRSLRVQYARRRHGNRVWLESYGDLSGADQANMLIVLKVNGKPRAVIDDTFTALDSGGWYSSF
jgi:hypothetical protein